MMNNGEIVITGSALKARFPGVGDEETYRIATSARPRLFLLISIEPKNRDAGSPLVYIIRAKITSNVDSMS